MTVQFHLLFSLLCIWAGSVCYAQQQPTPEVKELLSKAKKHWGDSLQLVYLQQAEQVAKKQNDQYGMGLIYQQMGNYYYTRLPDSSIQYHLKAHALLLRAGDKKMAAICLHSIGFVYEEMKHDPALALKYIELSMPIHRELKDTLELGNMYKYTGMLKGKLGRYAAAHRDIDSALHFYRSRENEAGVAVCWYDLAMIYVQEQKTDSAAYFFIKAKEYWQEDCAGRVFNIINKLLELSLSTQQPDGKNIIEENETMLGMCNFHYTDKLKFYRLCQLAGMKEPYLYKYTTLKDSLEREGVLAD